MAHEVQSLVGRSLSVKENQRQMFKSFLTSTGGSIDPSGTFTVINDPKPESDIRILDLTIGATDGIMRVNADYFDI